MKSNLLTVEDPDKKGLLSSSRIILFLILLLGIHLRLWQLASKPFWLDELGVAKAAFQPTLAETLEVVSHHVMAMPMDYVIAWIMAKFSHSEGFLRLPEVLWGTMTLLAGYQLCDALFAKQVTSLFAMFIMSLSQILIKYSQELRFYSPLIFFSIFSTWLGLIAANRSRTRDWVFFSISVLAGLLFHFFSILVLVTIFLWVITYYGKDGWAKRRNSFALCAAFLAGAFFASIAFFGGTSSSNRITLLQFESLPSFLLTGLGWKPPFPTAFVGWLPGIVLCLTALMGIIANLRQNLLSPPSVLFYSAIIQVMLVIVLNYIGGYFIYSRQIVMLVPIMAIYSAFGITWSIDHFLLRNKPNENSRERSKILVSLFGLFFLFISIPALKEFYQLKKTSTNEILSILSQKWQSAEPIYVDLGSEEVYIYYGKQTAETQALSTMIKPLIVAGQTQLNPTGSTWLVLGEPLSQEMRHSLQSAGFNPIFTPSHNTLYAQSLWYRK